MNVSALIDTNVVVYAYDHADTIKQQRAFDVLDYLATRGAGALSTQVLAEFFVAVTRRIATPLSAAEAFTRIENYVLSWTVVEMSGLIVLEAARGVRDYQFSFWDAQIWATARLNQIPIVLSEDFDVASAIEGVQFVNPFANDFQVTDWVR